MSAKSEMNEATLLSIGEVAARSGVAASALRYYESLGLIQSVRQGSSRRHFPRASLRRIAFIVFSQRIGYTLEEIAEQLNGLGVNRAPTKADWDRMSRDWRARVKQRIAELQRLDMDLNHCIGCGCLSLKRCKLSNPNDRAARAGAGARVWMGDVYPDD
ncbi:merR family transcriptional regulator [Bordetella ansorpii]|uniref:MerR family transcriptional regulator n=1 Tax=Bordetella ansorpii TaxID=288768 RepID=A0A157SE79_9BORD|nr:redox-sensitive transcriptional activator SoxR [Bordetella ansorpii]SAI68226.1 merR family transcriptional regulator [Bordetella ansorpii]